MLIKFTPKISINSVYNSLNSNRVVIIIVICIVEYISDYLKEVAIYFNISF